MIALLIAAQIVASGMTFQCTPTRVWDGDGPIWCEEGPRIRLAGIAAREIDETCRPGQPCPRASGHAARDYLVNLLGGAKGTTRDGHIIVHGAVLTCRSLGSGKGNRTAAFCGIDPAHDLSCAMVTAGYALRWKQYDGDRVCR